MLGPVAGQVGPPVQGQPALPRRACHHHLAEGGHHGPGGRAGQARLHRHGPPRQYRQAFLGRQLVKAGTGVVSLPGARGQEGDAGGIGPGLGQLYAETGAQETVRHLHEQAGAIAGGRVGSLSPAVLELAQAGQAHFDHGVARAAVQMSDKGDTTGVVLELGPVEARMRTKSIRHL